MNLHTSAAVKGWFIGLLTDIVDGESQSSKEVMNYVLLQIIWIDVLLDYKLKWGCNNTT